MKLCIIFHQELRHNVTELNIAREILLRREFKTFMQNMSGLNALHLNSLFLRWLRVGECEQSNMCNDSLRQQYKYK